MFVCFFINFSFLISFTDVSDAYGHDRKYMVMSGHTGAVTEAHFSRYGFDIYSCSSDKTLGIWDTFTGVRTAQLEGHSAAVNSVQSTRSLYNILCSGSDDGTVRIWDARERNCTATLKYGCRATATCFDAAGKYVMAGGHSNDIKIWDLRTNNTICKISGHEAAVTGISLSPCGSYLLSHAKDSCLRIWQVSPIHLKDRCVGFFHSSESFGNKHLIRCAWSPSGTKVSSICLQFQ